VRPALFGGSLAAASMAPLVGVEGDGPDACDAAGGESGCPLNGWRAVQGQPVSHSGIAARFNVRQVRDRLGIAALEARAHASMG
jgi:hypothetical protein